MECSYSWEVLGNKCYSWQKQRPRRAAGSLGNVPNILRDANLTCSLTADTNLNLRVEGAVARLSRAMASLASCSFCCSSVNCTHSGSPSTTGIATH